QAIDGARAGTLGYRAVGDSCFALLGTPMEAGRAFEPGDAEDAAHVLVVNRAFARRHFPQGAIGKRVRFIGEPGDAGWHTIVGIIRDVRSQRVDEEERPVVYESMRQRSVDWMAWLTIVVRTRAASAAVVESVRRAVAQVDASQP